MEGLKQAVTDMKADDISVELSAHQEGQRSSASFRLRAYRNGRKIVDESRDEDDLVQIEVRLDLAGRHQVAMVDRVEGAAHDADPLDRTAPAGRVFRHPGIVAAQPPKPG